VDGEAVTGDAAEPGEADDERALGLTVHVPTGGRNDRQS